MCVSVSMGPSISIRGCSLAPPAPPLADGSDALWLNGHTLLFLLMVLRITRQFSNHESRLLSRSHTFAIIVRLDSTPHLLRWYVHLSKDYYVQVPWTKGHWPLDDLWPQVCWGHMCDRDSTQGSLCLSPMGIHQCMWIQWSILQKYHIQTYYIQNEWSHSLFLNTVQVRQKQHDIAEKFAPEGYLWHRKNFNITVYRIVNGSNMISNRAV